MLLVIAGSLFFVFGIALLVNNSASQANEFYGLGRVVIGGLYGAISGLTWLATLLKSRWSRFSVKFALAVAGAAMICLFSDKPFFQLLAGTIGLVTLQSVVFHFFPPMRWSLATDVSRSDDYLDSRNAQFAIGDVVAVTLASAGGFALMQRTQTTVAALGYWGVIFWISIVMPVIAFCIFSAVRPTSGLRNRVSLLMLAAVISAAVALFVSVCQVGMQPGQVQDAIEDLLPEYGRVMVGYYLSLGVFAVAAQRATCCGNQSPATASENT